MQFHLNVCKLKIHTVLGVFYVYSLNTELSCQEIWIQHFVMWLMCRCFQNHTRQIENKFRGLGECQPQPGFVLTACGKHSLPWSRRVTLLLLFKNHHSVNNSNNERRVSSRFWDKTNPVWWWKQGAVVCNRIEYVFVD